MKRVLGVGDSLIDLLVQETNCYALQYIKQQNLTPLARANS